METSLSSVTMQKALCHNKAMLFSLWTTVNTLRPRQNKRHFADDIFKYIFLNENGWILIKISLKFVPKGGINNIPALVQIMAWCHPDDKPLSELMLDRSLTHICVTRPRWVKCIIAWNNDTAFSYVAESTHSLCITIYMSNLYMKCKYIHICTYTYGSLCHITWELYRYVKLMA